MFDVADGVLALLSAGVSFAAASVGLIVKLLSDVKKVHVLVNDRLSEALERIDQLDDAIRDAGLTPPDKLPRPHDDSEQG